MVSQVRHVVSVNSYRTHMRTVSLQFRPLGGGGKATERLIAVFASGTPAGTSPKMADVDAGENEGDGKPVMEPPEKVAGTFTRPSGAHVDETKARSIVARTERNGPGLTVNNDVMPMPDDVCFVRGSLMPTRRSSQHDAQRGRSMHAEAGSHALRYPLGCVAEPCGAKERQLVSCVADVMVIVTHCCGEVLPYDSGTSVIVDGLTVPPFVVASVTDVIGMPKAALAVLVFVTEKQ